MANHAEPFKPQMLGQSQNIVWPVAKRAFRLERRMTETWPVDSDQPKAVGFRRSIGKRAFQSAAWGAVEIESWKSLAIAPLGKGQVAPISQAKHIERPRRAIRRDVRKNNCHATDIHRVYGKAVAESLKRRLQTQLSKATQPAPAARGRSSSPACLRRAWTPARTARDWLPPVLW